MKTMKKALSIIVLMLFVMLCTTSYLQAEGSSAKYIGGSLVQGAGPDPEPGYDFFVDTDAAGCFPLTGKIWFEFTSIKDGKGWILTDQNRSTKRPFTIKANRTINYVVNPKAAFFCYSAVQGEGKSQ